VKHGLKESVIKKINLIFKKFSAVEKVTLYGSRAKGNFREGSDIDLTLHGADLNSEIVNKIRIEFEDSYLPYKFDLSIFSQLSNSDFIDHINRVGVTFYQKK
jgi:predicted nucleotidyltransferase